MNTRSVLIAFVCLCLTAPLFAQGPPANSGIVERWEYNPEEDGYFEGYADFKRNYVAFHGVDVKAWCADEPTVWDVWHVQDVYSPASFLLIKTTQKGDDMITSVWPIDILFYDHWCDGVLAMDPVATGTADVIVTDNDLFGGGYEPTPRMNAYHLSAHGVLYSTEDGEPMVFNGGYNCQWPGYPADPNTTGKCKQKIVLH